MAQTTYSQNFTKPPRREGVLSRDEYVRRARELAPRGVDLPQSKLIPLNVGLIRSAVRERENLRQHILDNLTNEALAARFGVSVRTIERAVARETWSNVA